jgi:hypothetical protein
VTDVLAYLFWHRPRAGVDVAVYEARLSAFHASLGEASRTERVRGAPWMDGGAGYLDWYFAADWADLGRLNRAAVGGVAAAPHAALAELAGWGAGGVAALVAGDRAFRPAWRWLAKPAGMTYGAFMARMPAGATLWQRQMTLGPQPEFALAGEGAEGQCTRHELVCGQAAA